MLNVTGHARGKTRGKVLAEYCLMATFCLGVNTVYRANTFADASFHQMSAFSNFR